MANAISTGQKLRVAIWKAASLFVTVLVCLWVPCAVAVVSFMVPEALHVRRVTVTVVGMDQPESASARSDQFIVRIEGDGRPYFGRASSFALGASSPRTGSSAGTVILLSVADGPRSPVSLIRASLGSSPRACPLRSWSLEATGAGPVRKSET